MTNSINESDLIILLIYINENNIKIDNCNIPPDFKFTDLIVKYNPDINLIIKK
jgi:hypothetical protein